MVISSDQFNSQRVQPKGHVFQPRKSGGDHGNCCVFSADHPVHTTPPGASNVVLLGARRRRDMS
jgi:hypothetical protein